MRVKTGCGRTADRDDEVAAARALAGQLDLRAVVGAARDRDVEAPAVDLDPAGRAVVGLLEADLGDRLGRGAAGRADGPRRPAAARRRAAGRAAGSGPSPARMSSNDGAAGRPAPRPRAGRAAPAAARSPPKKIRKKSEKSPRAAAAAVRNS